MVKEDPKPKPIPTIRVHKLSTDNKLHIQLSHSEEIAEVIGEITAESLRKITPDFYDDDLTLKLSDNPEYDMVNYILNILPQSELGSDGTPYSGGKLTHKDHNFRYRPYITRGNRYDHGLFQQAWLEEGKLRESWTAIRETLQAGHWYIDGPHAEELELVLFDIEKGWNQFIQEVLSFLIAGFAIFETIYDGKGNIVKLAFRQASQVEKWVFDADQRNLAGVILSSANQSQVFIPSHNLLIITYEGFGLDFEGNSPIRPIYKWIEQKQFLSMIQSISARKYGVPILTITSTDQLDSSDSSLLVSILDKLNSTDVAVIEMPNGRELSVIDPSSGQPSFEAAIRYCDEQITSMFAGQGSLLGLNGTGSYSLAEVADDKALRKASALAPYVLQAINGARGTPYHGVLRKMYDAKFGPPLDGIYPQLKWQARKDDDSKESTWFSNVALAFEKGLITLTPDDETRIRDALGLYQTGDNT